MSTPSVREVCARVRAHSRAAAALSEEDRNAILLAAADALVREKEAVLAANAEDVARSRAAGKPEGIVDRLTLTEARIGGIAEGLKKLVELPCPVGEILESRVLANGLKLERVRVPFGVVGIIYEARPNVTADVIGLAVKSGNAVVLRGSSDALASNRAIVAAVTAAIRRIGFDPDFIGLIEDGSREGAVEFMRQKDLVDVLIPRGSAGLIRAAVEQSLIPVIETGTGNCHIYVERTADAAKALPILLNAKTQRNSVCNAAESLLVDRAIAGSFLPLAGKALVEKGVTLHACPESFAVLRAAGLPALPATEDDYSREYLGPEISIKLVEDYREAAEWVNAHSTHHSDAIVTEDEAAGEYFLAEVDSAAVYVNASTRFTDGFEFGLGAEMGISTQKLHARGPMGLRELTSYKYVIRGNGQIRK